MFTRDKLNQLYQYGFALTANEELSMDLVHDAIEKLISRTFVLNKMAYAKTVMRNKFYDILKSKSYTTSVVFNEEDIYIENDFDLALDANLSIGKIMEKIAPVDRELLFLWAVEEYTINEISKLMKIPKGTLTSRLKRLRDKLQKESGDESE